jgi:hypothetical protein
MPAIVGPVIARKDGYAFDLWTPEEGLSRSFCYQLVDDACYARRFEIRSHSKGRTSRAVACATVDQFASALEQKIPIDQQTPRA